MGNVRAAFAVLACLSTLLACDCHAYRGYVPIRSVNERPYIEPDCYCKPGVITLAGNAWMGLDNLAGIPDSIRVFTEIVSDPQVRLWLPIEEAQAELVFELKTVGIKVAPPVIKPQDLYRPLLHLLIFVMPTSDGHAVHLSLRYLERSNGGVRESQSDGETWQVLTWERQTSFIACTGDLLGAIKYNVKGYADEFTRHYALEKRQADQAAKKEPQQQTALPSAPKVRSTQSKQGRNANTGCLSNYRHPCAPWDSCPRQ